MARVLAISSYVAHGHVGLGAIVPALHRLGHEVIALPTVVLSNHAGHSHCAGQQISPVRLGEMLDALEANGSLKGVDAMLTGYLPSVAHVRLAAKAASRLSASNASAAVYCDPILGDDPGGLYIDAEAAEAIRDELVGLADMIFPNCFELSYLARRDVEDAVTALDAIQELSPKAALVSSLPGEPGELANLLYLAGDAAQCTVPLRSGVAHGTGDLLSALFVGHRLRGGRASAHFSMAVAGVEAAILAAEGQPELCLARSPEAWANPSPLPIQALW